mmetsp:Transcript_92836/g.233381  ORF Transcript_92836/g.233381 Transcript_92836/m.233381 type:complete len:233 (+) Transcript_92836:1146-1844(+)
MPMGRRILAAEILLRDGIHKARRVSPQLIDENALCIGPLHTIHGVVHKREILPLNELLDRLEVKDFAQQANVIIRAREDLHTSLAIKIVRARCGNINFRDAFTNFVLLNCLCVRKHLLGDLFRCWAAVLAIVLDAEVLVQATGIVRCGQNESTKGCKATFAGPNDGACGWCAQESILANPHCFDTVCNGHLDDDLDCSLVPIPSVATDHQSAAFNGHVVCLQSIKDGLHKVV